VKSIINKYKKNKKMFKIVNLKMHKEIGWKIYKSNTVNKSRHRDDFTGEELVNYKKTG
jgi:hypothetical protein